MSLDWVLTLHLENTIKWKKLPALRWLRAVVIIKWKVSIVMEMYWFPLYLGLLLKVVSAMLIPPYTLNWSLKLFENKHRSFFWRWLFFHYVDKTWNMQIYNSQNLYSHSIPLWQSVSRSVQNTCTIPITCDQI